MPWPRAFIYESADSRFSLAEVCRALEPVGYGIQHPLRRIVLELDDIGGQRPTTTQRLQQAIDAGEDTIFLFWRAWNESLYCEITVGNDVRSIAFSLKGVSLLDREHVGQALLAWFCAKAEQGAGLGFVFDPQALTEGYEWRDFFERRCVLRPKDLGGLVPSKLLIRDTFLMRIQGFKCSRYRDSMFSIDAIADFAKVPQCLDCVYREGSYLWKQVLDLYKQELDLQKQELDLQKQELDLTVDHRRVGMSDRSIASAVKPPAAVSPSPRAGCQ